MVLMPVTGHVDSDVMSSFVGKDVPLLTIVIPLLKSDPEFGRCMSSIVCAFEGGALPEVVVVTSTPSVALVKAEYPWARVLAETSKGIYGAMNDGVRASRGAYLYFLGKDDIVLPSIRSALDEIKKQQPYALFCDVYWGGQGVASGGLSRLQFLSRNACHQGIIYSREAIKSHGPYFRKMKLQADHLMNIKIVWDRQNSSRITRLPVPLAWYSDRGLSSTVRSDPVFRRLYPVVLHKYVGWWASCLLLFWRRIRGRP